MAKEYRLRWVESSEFYKQIDNSHENAYGLVVAFDEESGKDLPMICGHGGSMWLCYSCAEAIVAGKPAPVKPCPWHVGPGPFTFSCSWPGCKLNSREIISD